MPASNCSTVVGLNGEPFAPMPWSGWKDVESLRYGAPPAQRERQFVDVDLVLQVKAELILGLLDARDQIGRTGLHAVHRRVDVGPTEADAVQQAVLERAVEKLASRVVRS
jgi:hypothetical protein